MDVYITDFIETTKLYDPISCINHYSRSKGVTSNMTLSPDTSGAHSFCEYLLRGRNRLKFDKYLK